MIRFYSDSDSDEELNDNIPKHNCCINNCDFCTSDIMKLFIHNHNHLKEKKLLCLKPNYILEGGEKRKRETDSNILDPSKFGSIEEMEDDYKEMEEDYEDMKKYLDTDDDSEDEFYQDLMKDITIAEVDYKPKKSKSFDWAANQRKHGELALKTINYLFKEIDTIGLMGYQIDILESILKYGIKQIQCNHPFRYHIKELQCLWTMESDSGEGSGDLEDILINVLQKGVLTDNSSFILNSPRQYKGDYVYIKIIEFLDEDKNLVLTTFRELLDLWLSLIEDIDDDNIYACYKNQFYTLPKLIDLIDNKLKMKKVREYYGSRPYTFKELYDEMKQKMGDDVNNFQKIVDYWEKEMLDFNEPF